MTDDISSRVRLHALKVLSDNHYVLRRAEYDYQRRDDRWQRWCVRWRCSGGEQLARDR